jgi:hypothetical protein
MYWSEKHNGRCTSGGVREEKRTDIVSRVKEYPLLMTPIHIPEIDGNRIPGCLEADVTLYGVR